MWHAKETAVRVAVDALQTFGAYGVMRQNLIEKLVRDALTMMHTFTPQEATKVRIGTRLSATTQPLDGARLEQWLEGSGFDHARPSV